MPCESENNVFIYYSYFFALILAVPFFFSDIIREDKNKKGDDEWQAEKLFKEKTP
jgi:hypothetical protein